MIYDYFSQTDPGRIRENNEDSVALNAHRHVAVLADGMGGYNAGEVASAMATGYVCEELSRWLARDGGHPALREVKNAMQTYVDKANRLIYNASNNNPQYCGMGTTLVMGVFQGAQALIGHVGDSRCYRQRGQTLQQITRDHSLLQEQIDAGLLTVEQAQHATHKNLVTRALGVDDAVSLEVNEFRVEDGDIYLLCSDGLNDMVGDSRIAAILQEPVALEQMAGMLIEQANSNGGRDNISVILARAKAKPVRRGLLSRMLGQQ